MKPSLCLAAAVATQTSILEVGKKTLFGSAPMPNIDRNDASHIRPHKDVTLHYTTKSSDAPDANVNVTHTMKYPTILLEEIASLINVDCSANSIALTFDDRSVYSTIRGTWSTNQTLVLITNHLGDCDEELERSFFIAKKLHWDSANLIVTADSRKTDVEHTAATTEISFGGLPAVTPSNLTSRALVLDPSFTLATALALPKDTVLYSYPPYVTVTANTASFAASTTISGYLKYNWWFFKLEKFYFDLDASFEANLALTAAIKAAYGTTFSYAPAQLQYGFVIPGILEIGPQLSFGIDAYVSASAAVNVTAQAGVKLQKGNVHLDVLNNGKVSTSGWTPGYWAEAGVEGMAVARIDPVAKVTVELEAKLFGGLVDLSTGITAKPGFTNTFTLAAQAGISTTGAVKSSASSTGLACPNGLKIDSDFIFGLEAYVTQWYRAQLYSVSVPIVDQCYTWVK